MSIHQIPAKLIKIDGALPPFPANVEINAELVPEELFGLKDLSGQLSLHPQGAKVSLTTDLFAGGIRATSAHRLPQPDCEAPFFDLRFRLKGNIATVFGSLASDSVLPRAIHIVAAHLPGLLASALMAPVDIRDMFGNVGNAYFSVEVKGTFERVVRVDSPDRAVPPFLSDMSGLKADGADRILAAQRYLNQSLWLAYAARHPQQFAAERLLNLHKVLEVLYPHSGEVNLLRAALSKLGLRTEVIELFASVVYIRNQVDVGHPKVALLSEADFTTFHQFLGFATEMVGWLVRDACTRATQEPGSAQPRLGNADIPALRKAATLMQSVNPLRPEDFFSK